MKLKTYIYCLTGKMLFDVWRTAKSFVLQRVILPCIRTKRFKVHFPVLPRRYSEISREISAATLRVKNATAFFGLIVFLSGCSLYYAKAHYTGTTEIMEVRGSGYNREGSISHARDSADYACKCQKKGMAVILSENTTYTGALVNETVDKMAKQAEKVAWTLGKTDTSKAIGATSSPDDYQTVLKFRCSE